MSCSHDAGQMLLKTQTRFVGKPVRVGTDCSEKAFYFPPDLALVCGVRYAQSGRVLLPGLHLLLPATRTRPEWPIHMPSIARHPRASHTDTNHRKRSSQEGGS